MNNKTILFVIPSLHVGGAESQLCLVLPLLQSKGWDITVFLTSGIGELSDQLTHENIKVLRPQFMGSGQPATNKLLRLPHMLLSFFCLSWYLLKNRPQIVHFTLTEAYLLGGLSCVLLRQKNLIMSRRSLNNYQNKYPILRKLEHWLHTKMTAIVCNSQAIQHQLTHSEGVPVDKLHLIYNGVDMQRFTQKPDVNQIREHFKLPTSNLRMIVVANIIPYKGHATLLHALASIAAQLPENWQLLCVGANTNYQEELLALSHELQIANHVHFLGHQDSKAVVQLLAISNIAISPSYEEGLSNSIIEALASGLPMVATNVGGNPEIVDHDETGIIVPSKDPIALSKAILDLLHKPEYAQQLAMAGKQRMAQRFSLEACANAYDNLYMNIASHN